MDLPRRVIAMLIVVAAIACTWMRPMDNFAREHVNDGLKRAVATYATARLLHGVVSVMQGTQVNAEPAGVGATFAPGQVLAPAAEMLKQFSDVMLFVCVAFGIEKLLISIAAYKVLSALLTVVAMGWLAYSLLRRPAPNWLSKSFVALLVINFAVPVTVIGSEAAFKQFMAGSYHESQESIVSLSGTTRIETPVVLPEESSRGVLEKIRNWWKTKSDSVSTHYDALKDKAESTIEHVIALIAIFAMQTIILPLLLLLGMYVVARALVQAVRTPMLRLSAADQAMP